MIILPSNDGGCKVLENKDSVSGPRESEPLREVLLVVRR